MCFEFLRNIFFDENEKEIDILTIYNFKKKYQLSIDEIFEQLKLNKWNYRYIYII
jgi:hypothetical protein